MPCFHDHAPPAFLIGAPLASMPLVHGFNRTYLPCNMSMPEAKIPNRLKISCEPQRFTERAGHLV